MITGTRTPSEPRRLRALLRAVTLTLGAGYAAAAALRESMNADGMNYLDMGDAYLRGDWSTAINTVWSPLYSWLLAGALRLLSPSARWEFATVHLVNFLIYVGALACFEFFWRRVIASADLGVRQDDQMRAGLPRWTWWSLGYMLFAWSSLNLIEIWSVTPDMCVAAAVYLAGGLLLGIRLGTATRRTFLALGLVLGLGYLAKAALFPMGFVFLAAAVAVQRDLRRGLARALPAVVVFTLIGGAFVAVLSIREGRFTFGDAGRIVYLRYVQGVPFPHWQPGVVENLGTPDHPVRRAFDDPVVYEFATPVGGTYPLSFDPYYWFEGLSTILRPARQLAAVSVNLDHYRHLFLHRQGGALAAALILLATGVSRRPRHRLPHGAWELALVALAAFTMYVLIHVTPRYLGPFLVLFWAGALTHVRLPDSRECRRLLVVAPATMLLFFAADLAAGAREGLAAFFGLGGPVEIESTALGAEPSETLGHRSAKARPSEIAAGLQAGGLKPGEQVGFIGYSFDAYWARLAGVKIVAEIVPAQADRFWRAPPARRARVLEAFAASGAAAVVAQSAPSDVPLDGWTPVDDTGYLLYRLPAPRGPRESDPRSRARSSTRRSRAPDRDP